MPMPHWRGEWKRQRIRTWIWPLPLRFRAVKLSQSPSSLLRTQLVDFYICRCLCGYALQVVIAPYRMLCLWSMVRRRTIFRFAGETRGQRCWKQLCREGCKICKANWWKSGPPRFLIEMALRVFAEGKDFFFGPHQERLEQGMFRMW